MEKIAFERELSRGIVTYNEKVGRWWQRQASNPIHKYAYRNIAGFIRSSFPRAPEVIVDYACGNGNLLLRLHRQFPESRLIGLDGSSYLLGEARKRLTRASSGAKHRIRLVETLLPDFALPSGSADLVVFCFPNIVPHPKKDTGEKLSRHFEPNDLAVAWELAGRHDPENGRSGDPAPVVYATLLRDRLISRNMRFLLKRGGICIRVEYGNVRREEFPRLELLRTGFEEGSLDQEVTGRTPTSWFRILACRYYRSGVFEDVYHQSRDESDLTGGYFITVLRAV